MALQPTDAPFDLDSHPTTEQAQLVKVESERTNDERVEGGGEERGRTEDVTPQVVKGADTLLESVPVPTAASLAGRRGGEPNEVELKGGGGKGSAENVLDSSFSSIPIPQDPSLPSSDTPSLVPSSSQTNDLPPPPPSTSSDSPAAALPPPLPSAPTSSSSSSSVPLPPPSPSQPEPSLLPSSDAPSAQPSASESTPSGPSSSLVVAPSPVPSPSNLLPPPTSSSTPPISTSTSSSSLHFTHPIKKFTAVSVNKRFLSNTNSVPASTSSSSSTATSSSAPSTLKSSLSTSSTSKLPPIQPSHPPSRLLTTKLVHPTPRVAAPPPTHQGWARPTPSPGAVPSSSLSKGPDLGAPSLFKSRGGDSFSWGPGPGGERRGAAGGPGGGLRSQFPTTAESAEERRVNAQAAKQAAAAKSQAVLLELDAFRGVHLDPNAHHWDDVDDEDDDFLDDVVEFGDGTQYTIDHTQPPPPEVEEEVEEKQQRYPPANDFDRSWPQKQGGGPPSQHPHPPSARAPPPHQQQSNYRPSSSPSSDHHLHYPPGSQQQPHLARPPPTSAHLPSKPRAGEDPSRVLFNARSNQFEPPTSGRPGPPQGPAGGLGVGGPGGRRPSNDRQPIRGFDRPPPPHVELQRSLPPHLEQGRGGPPPPPPAAVAPVPQPAPPPSRPAWGLARESSRAAGGVGLGGLSSPPAAPNKDFPPPSALSANRSALPPQSNAFATSATPSLPPPHSRSARVSFSTPTPVARPPSSVGSPETALHHLPHPSLALRRTSTEHGGGPTPTQVVEDVSAMQKDEMHSAADRAKLRRQKEEEERQAAIERAKAKAKALEERFAPKVEVVEILKKEEEKKEAVPAVVASSPAPFLAPVAAPVAPAPVPTPPTKAPAPAAAVSSTPGTPARPSPVEKWKLSGNLLPSAGMATPPPPRILKDGPIPDDVQVIDFANLGSLVASQTQASSSRTQTPQPSPTKSRRPVATDFFDHPPPSPSKPSPTPSSSLPAKVESSINTSLPPRPPPTTEFSSTSSPFAQPPTPSPPPPSSLPIVMEARSSSKGPPSPTKQAHHPVELSSFDDAMARIRGAMVPRSSSSPTPTNGLSAPPSPTKSSTPRPLPPPEPESDQTKPDRPTSPILAWKVYPVRIPSSSAVRRPLVDSKQAKLYNRADAMIKVVDPVSWEPALWKTPLGKSAVKKDASRDEMLHSGGGGTGNGGRKVSGGNGKATGGPSVYLPTRRGWERLKMRAEVKAQREASNAAAALATAKATIPSPPLPPPSSASTPKPTPSPTPPTSQLPSNPTITNALPPTPTTLPSLPSRPGVVPSLSVIPPTPLRPLKPSRAMEESSWRRRAPLPEVVVAEQEKEGGGKEKEEGVESIAIGETTEGGTVVLNRSMKGVEVRIQARAKVEEVIAPAVVVVKEEEVKKVEEKPSPLPTFEVQQPQPPQPTVDLSSPTSESSPSPKPIASSSLKLPEGADVGFYRDRSPSIGTVSQEQLEPLVRFMVTSEIDTFHAEELGPKSTDPGVEEDVGPEFASIMRSPSSSGGDLTRTESSNSIPRLPTNMSGVVLSPPSAATSSAWSKSVPKVDREQHVRDVWAQSSSSSSSPNDPSRNVGGLFPSSLHFSSPDLHSQGGHQNNSGSIRSFAGGPHSNNSNSGRGQFPSPQQQQRNFVGGQQQQQQQAQGFPSPYNTPLSRPNGASQPNSPAMYQSSFNAGSPRPNPSAPAFPNPQLGRNPPSLNQTAPHRPSFSAYPSSLSISSSGSSQGPQQQQQPGGGGGSMMYSSQQPTLNPTSQPFMMRPGAGGVPIITSPSPLVGISGPPFPPTAQGVWLPVVPVPPLRPNPQHQQQHGGSYSGLPSPSPVFSSPSLHQQSPYSSHNSLPSTNHNHNLNHFNSSPNLPHHAPTYRNLSDFSSSPNSPSSMSGGFGGGRQAPPHQLQNQQQHGMFSSNGRGGPMDNHARGGSNTSSNSNSNSTANANAQPIYASIGSTPQGGGSGSYGSGYAGGGGSGGGRRW